MKKRTAPLFLAVLTACALACPALAAEAPSPETMFAHETNVDIDSRIIVFDLYEMGDQLKPTALNVTMETIQNRVATNRLAGKYTWVFVDEVYVRPEAA